MTIDQEILNLINQERSNAGLNPLLLHSQLDSVANNHSEDMALEDFFSHTSSNGTNWSDRLAAVYQGTRLAENISAGLATPEAVVQDWMNSDPHRDNILDPNLEHIGIGYYHLPNDTGSVNYNHYWNLTFGAGGPPPVQVPDDDTNDTIAQATDTGLSGFGTYNISAEIDPQNDVDLFELYLDAGDRLVADIDAELIGSS
ncbi:MAG: CAP domain-containing protein, partial [Pleurocapsa sp. MO_226.B13]|nr:CAP domain-containing protein [Pleurocapsa sp. MO_226.B13]